VSARVALCRELDIPNVGVPRAFPFSTSDGTLPAARRRNHRPEGLHLQRERQRALVLMDTPLIPGLNVRVINEMTSESAECFVTSLREKAGKAIRGIGFFNPN